MRELWPNGLSWLVPDVQELKRRDTNDHAICGKTAGAGVAEHECLGEVEAGG